MKILAISTNTGDSSSHIADEMQRITKLRAAGVFEQVNLKTDRSGAVMILDAPTANTAERLASLPLVEDGLTHFAVTELMTLDELSSSLQ